MQIPSYKLQQIRDLLYDDRPSYTRGPGTIENDEVLARLINEVLDVLGIELLEDALIEKI